MKKIKLTQGKYALVNNEDFDFLNQWSWQYSLSSRNRYGYATRTHWIIDINGKKTGKSQNISMHRVIMNTPKGLFTDHINGNGLDNRKENLRICNVNENRWNAQIQKSNISGYKGVSWANLNKKWRARITQNDKIISLGLFKTKEGAALAYNRAAQKYYGEFARLNII